MRPSPRIMTPALHYRETDAADHIAFTVSKVR
jgi:hypothetical protein